MRYSTQWCFLFFLALSFIFTPYTSIYSKHLTTAEKLKDLHQMVATISAGYGPLHYKKMYLGIDLDQLEAEYTEKILNTSNNRDFYYLMIQFIAEFKDSHFSGRIPTDHTYSLPIYTDLVEGKVLISFVDREKIDQKSFPFNVGDEIVQVNGRKVSDLVDELSQYIGEGFDLTSRDLATMYLLIRPAAIFPLPAEKEITLSIRRGTSSIIDRITLSWNESGEALDESTSWEDRSKSFSRGSALDFGELSLDGAIFENLKNMHYRHFCSGKTRVQIPSDATIIMEEPFVAYYHPTEKGNIGYLRIPHYSPYNEVTGYPEFESRFLQYQYAVYELEKNTVGLIIDQDYNCGGSVDYLHRIVSLFATESYPPMNFTLLASKESYLDFTKWKNELFQSTLAKVKMNTIRDLIKTSWKESRFMTPMTSIDGNESFYPDRVHYTKPIIVLINELSGSGGDAFPALLQGIGRAKLLGTRTMGAGGHVQEIPPLNYSQIKVRMTKSLFYRPSGVAVENNGAEPDIPYTITRDDIMYDYRPYQQFYLNEMFKLLSI